MQINPQTKIDQQTTLLLLHHQTWFKSLSWPLFSSHNLFPKTLLSRWTTDSDSLDGFVAYKFRIAACQLDNMLVWLATIDWGEFIIWKCHNLFKFAHSTIPSFFCSSSSWTHFILCPHCLLIHLGPSLEQWTLSLLIPPLVLLIWGKRKARMFLFPRLPLVLFLSFLSPTDDLLSILLRRKTQIEL